MSILVDPNALFIHVDSQTYPLTLRRIREREKGIMIPSTPTEEIMLEIGYAVVHPTTPNQADKVESGPPELVDGKWQQTWIYSSFTPEELAEQLLAYKEIVYAELNRILSVTAENGIEFIFDENTIERIQLRDQDMNRILSIARRAQLDPNATYQFRTRENNFVSVTAEQVAEIEIQALNERDRFLAAYWTLKDTIREAQTRSDIPTLPETL